MRYLVLAVLPVILLGQANGVVDGTVVSSSTHVPVAGVEVTIQSTESRVGAAYTANTDARGAFRIEGIHVEGAFRASSGGPGYLPNSVAFHLTVAGGPVHLQLELSAMPKLRGRVVDGEGHPVADATVQLVHPGGGGRPSAKSGSEGVFVFDQLPPGSFQVRAIPPPKLEAPKSPQDEPLIWAPTYYPNVTESFRAELLTMLAGQDRDDCDIKLRAVPVFHVRGVVVDEDGKPVPGAAVKLLSPDGLDARSHASFEEPAAHAAAADDGAFDLAGVRPGEWFLMASGKRGGKSLSGVMTGMISKGDWENVRLQLVTPFTVKGTVERPDTRNAGSSRHTWVGLIPAWQTRLMGIHDQNGAFEIDDIVPGKYQVLLEESLPGSYVDSVQFGGRDVMGQTVDVMDNALRLRVVYKTNGGRVQGSVEKGGGGTVVLLPKEPALQNTQFMRWGRCDASGRFEIGNLRPGAYYAAAFSRLDMFDLSYGLYYGGIVDPALIARILERGAAVMVDAGQTATAALALSPWPGQ